MAVYGNPQSQTRRDSTPVGGWREWGQCQQLRTRLPNLTIGSVFDSSRHSPGRLTMPILTTETLATRSRQARFAIDHCTTPPTSIEELKSRIAARPRAGGMQAVAYVYGPNARHLNATDYDPHFAVGVTDHEVAATYSLHGSVELETIEQSLAELLEKYPATAGYDVVLSTIPTTGEMWPAGLKADYELRECHAKARRAALAKGLRHVWYAR
jgi:hypothetical protein